MRVSSSSLLFFALDVGDDVAQDVEGGHAGVACSADGLHGGDEDALNAEAIGQRLEGEDQADGAAVGVGDDVSAGLLAPGLGLEQVEVGGVDLGDDEGHVALHAEGAGVGDDGAAGGGEFGLQFASNVGVEGGEDNAGGSLGGVGGDDHLADAVGEGRVQLPFGGFRVGFAAGFVAGGEPGDLKPGVGLEQLDKALADHSGCAKNAYLMWSLHGCMASILDYCGWGPGVWVSVGSLLGGIGLGSGICAGLKGFPLLSFQQANRQEHAPWNSWTESRRTRQ